MKFARFLVYSAFFVLATLFAGNQGNAQTHLTLQDLLSVDPLGETALSPDGKTVAFVRSGQIVLMPSQGGWPVLLTTTQGGKSGIAWSPDGQKLAYASQGSIWVVPIAGGAPVRLTNAPPGPGDPRQATDRGPQWSPKGRWILFQSGRSGRNGLYVVSQDGASTTALTSNQDVTDGRWSPDGSQIVYVARDKSYFSGRLELARFDDRAGQRDGEAKVLYTSPIDRGGGWSIRGAEWAPDGKTLVTVLQNSGWNHLYTISTAGGEPKEITAGNFEDEDPIYSPDGKLIAFVSNRELAEANDIWLVSAKGGDVRRVTHFETPGISSRPQWSPDGTRVFFNHQSPLASNELFVQAVQQPDKPVALTHTTPANYAAAAQVPERVTWKSKDGREIAGLLYTPKRKERPTKPAILWIHGGPEGQDVYRTDVWAQYLAQAGYVVLEPNYRGSSGYGEVFRNLNVEDSNGGEVDDVAAGAEYLISNGLADPGRIGIGGGSHGGTMVAYAVTRYPELFAAAAELYGVVDRELFVYRTNRSSSIRWMMKMGGTPSEKPEVYRRANILLSIDKVKTPVLIMHGEDDPQVPPSESAQFARALQQHHKTYFYFTYPNELHGFTQREHRLDAWQKQLAFFEHYLKPGFGTTTTSTEEVVFPGDGKSAHAH